jgi:hypothetical protein
MRLVGTVDGACQGAGQRLQRGKNPGLPNQGNRFDLYPDRLAYCKIEAVG